MATAYGSTLGLDSTKMILALLLTQLVAFPCSLAFSKISGKIGTIKMLGVGILVYIVVCGVGFFMGFNIEPHQFAYEQNYTEVLNGNQGSVPGPVLEQLSQEGAPFYPARTGRRDSSPWPGR
ncbi:hypothetical protein SDC9_197910 [bioreactor metagenome]|uniref:Uncharacterized protein n=1 Tax=bioreactor metagenome TaxID=1076179 RepID=A0A645IPL3_9ZZZZ